MDFETLKTQSPDALRASIAEARAELRDLRFRLSSGTHRQVRDLRALRTKIAQMEMLLTSSRS